MSNEIRKLADEVLGFAAHCSAFPEKLSPRMLDMMGKVYKVAQGYLAEHPADDEELVTEEWLRSVGFEPDGVHLALSGWGPSRNGCIQVYDAAKWILNGTETHRLSTRGDVRLLFRALRIELKEARAGK